MSMKEHPYSSQPKEGFHRNRQKGDATIQEFQFKPNIHAALLSKHKGVRIVVIIPYFKSGEFRSGLLLVSQSHFRKVTGVVQRYHIVVLIRSRIGKDQAAYSIVGQHILGRQIGAFGRFTQCKALVCR